MVVTKATVDRHLAVKRWVINWCSVDFELSFISTDKKALLFKIQRISCIKVHRDIQFCVRCGENLVPRCAPK
jgi:rRNA maturation endonuclease Nob1